MRENIKPSIKSYHIWLRSPKTKRWSFGFATHYTGLRKQTIICDFLMPKTNKNREFTITSIPKPECAIRVPPNMEYFKVTIQGIDYSGEKLIALRKVNPKEVNKKPIFRHQY